FPMFARGVEIAVGGVLVPRAIAGLDNPEVRLLRRLATSTSASYHQPRSQNRGIRRNARQVCSHDHAAVPHEGLDGLAQVWRLFASVVRSIGAVRADVDCLPTRVDLRRIRRIPALFTIA